MVTQRQRLEEKVSWLLNQAEAGDASVMKGIREHTRANPGFLEKVGYSLPRVAQGQLIKRCCGTNLLLEEAIRSKLRDLRAELLGESPTPVKTLLVDRVVSSWLILHALEFVYSQEEPDLSHEDRNGWLGSIREAQGGYLDAMESLRITE